MFCMHNDMHPNNLNIVLEFGITNYHLSLHHEWKLQMVALEIARLIEMSPIF